MRSEESVAPPRPAHLRLRPGRTLSGFETGGVPPVFDWRRMRLDSAEN